MLVQGPHEKLLYAVKSEQSVSMKYRKIPQIRPGA